MSEAHDPNKDKFLADVMMVIADTEELLRATADDASEKVAVIRARTRDRLAGAKIKLAEAEASLIDNAKQAGRATDDYVNDNPWRAVGIAAGAGFVLGLLMGRR